MPYLNVDDQLAFHPKAIAAGNAAMGCWSRCGSWAAGSGLDGYVPADIAKAIGKPSEIKRLVDTGWWEPVTGGYQMHDYSDHNITAAEAAALSEKRARAGRIGGSRRPGLTAIKGQANG